jgi:hypothetical protein
MQAAARLHHLVTESLFVVSDCILNNSISLHSANGMLDSDSDFGDAPVVFLVFRTQFLAPWFLLGLDDGNTVTSETLETGILKQPESVRNLIACFVSGLLVMFLALAGRTQEENPA